MALSVLYLVTHWAHSLSLPVRGKETEASGVKKTWPNCMTGKGQNQNQNPRLLTPDSGLSFYVRHPFCQLEDQLWLYLQALIKVLGMVEKAWTLELNLHLNSCLLLTSKSLTCRTAMSLLGLHPSVIYWNEVQHPCLVWEAGPGGSRLC